VGAWWSGGGAARQAVFRRRKENYYLLGWTVVPGAPGATERQASSQVVVACLFSARRNQDAPSLVARPVVTTPAWLFCLLHVSRRGVRAKQARGSTFST
jgi:hypothetical protein